MAAIKIVSTAPIINADDGIKRALDKMLGNKSSKKKVIIARPPKEQKGKVTNV